jgi:lipopolysaccharide/colanic/teichoic acid biosynthesis glycosyltransferase
MQQRLLIVDDNPAQLRLLEMIFEHDPYSIRTAVSGDEALAIVRGWQPDLILLDIMMPGIDGFETARQLQSFEGTRDVPIIMVTALGRENEPKGLSSGAIDFVTKPFNSENLRERVKAQLRYKARIKDSNRYVMDRIIALPAVVTHKQGSIYHRIYRISKRLFDLMVALAMTPVAVPLLILIAIAIRIESPGPIVFVQQRTGWNGERFKMYKLRTMVQNAEELKEKYRHLNEMTWPDFKITNDPRVTRVGKFLRKTSLDELPQLWNIINGTMSFVGPRPTSFKAETYQLWHTERLEAKPGLTGLWQIGGRADVDFDERVELDIEYIERQSWALDLQILAATFTAVISGRGAH